MRLLPAIRPLHGLQLGCLPFGGLLAAISLMVAPAALMASAQAADYDRAYRHPAPPPAYAGPAVDPRCRVVPQPEANLFGSTARFRPTLICTSRGLYADSFGPYPLYYPYQGGYGYER